MLWSIILTNLEDNRIILTNPSYGTLMEIISTDGTTNNVVHEDNISAYIKAYGMNEYNSELARAMDDIHRKNFYNIRCKKYVSEQQEKYKEKIMELHVILFENAHGISIIGIGDSLSNAEVLVKKYLEEPNNEKDSKFIRILPPIKVNELTHTRDFDFMH